MSKKQCLLDSGLNEEEQVDMFGEVLDDEGLRSLDFDVVLEAINNKRLQSDRQVAQTVANMNTLGYMKSYDGDKLQSLTAMLVNDIRGKAEGISVERDALAMNNTYHSQMIGFMEAMEQGKFQLFKGMFTDVGFTAAQREVMRDVVRQMMGGKAKNPEAAKFAQEIGKVLDNAHNRHAKAGGQRATLADYGLPQKQDPIAVGKVSREEWIDFTWSRLDVEAMKERYGADDSQLKSMVSQSYDSIVTDGASKIGDDPNVRIAPKSMTKKASDMHQNSRFLKFKDGDSWLDYQEQFGSGNVYMSVTDHISNLSRETALMERFGPDYEQGYAFAKAQVLQSSNAKGVVVDTDVRLTDSYFEEIKGWSGQRPHNLTHAINTLKSVEVASKMGGAFLSTFSDLVYAGMTRHFNGMATNLGFMNYVKQYSGDNRKFAAQMGLTAEYAISRTVSAFEYQTQMGAGRARNAAEFVVRMSNLTAHTIAARQAFGLEMNAHVANVTKDSWSDVNVDTKKAFKRYGIDETDFVVMANAKRTTKNGVDFIDPQNLPFDQQRKLQGMIGEETDFAIPTPGVRERVMVSFATDPNTVAGAASRAGTQFMSFGTTVMTKHWARAGKQANIQGKLAYAGFTLASTTLLGMGVVMAKDIAAGRDVTEEYLNSKEFVFKGMLQGGYLSFMGDLMLKQTGWDDMWSAPLSGGALNDVMGVLVFGNAQKVMAGEFDEMNISKDAVEFLRKNTPGTNVWYTRLAVERALWDNLRLMSDPDFKRNMKRRERKMKREDNRGYWWKPNT